MTIWEPLVTAVAAFAATNIDDIFVLALFYSQLSETLKRWHIVVGQLVGFSALIAISLLGFVFSFLIPHEYIGLLGLLPIILGIRAFLNRNKEDEHQAQVNTGSTLASIASVTGVTFANGADNIGIYTPLFASSTLPALLVMLAVFYIMLLIWCLIGYFITRQPTIARLLERYGHIIMPLVLIGLGVFIIVESGTLSLVGLG